MSSPMGWRRQLVLLGVVLATGTGCKGGPPNPYPDDVVDNFVSACRANAAERVCTCAIDRIQRRFTLDEFRAFEERMAQGETPKELVDSVADCQGR
jgi:hypothetical protein